MSDTPTFTSVTAGTVEGLTNTAWSGTAITGRAATEDQLGAVDLAAANNTAGISTANTAYSNLATITGGHSGVIPTLSPLTSAGFSVSDGTSIGAVNTGDTLSFRGYNYIETVYSPSGRLLSAGIDSTTRARIDALSTTAVTPGTLITPSSNLTMNNLTVQTYVNAGSYSVGGATYLNANGFNANNQTVNGVAAGSGTQAANGAQLYQLAVGVNGLAGKATNVGRRIEQSGAMMSALSGLKIAPYDVEDPLQFMGPSMGSYKGRSAVAAGAGLYLGESNLIHLGVAATGGETMYNGGLTHKMGTARVKKTAANRQGPSRMLRGLYEDMEGVLEETQALESSSASLREQDLSQQTELAAMQEQIERLIKERAERN